MQQCLCNIFLKKQVAQKQVFISNNANKKDDKDFYWTISAGATGMDIHFLEKPAFSFKYFHATKNNDSKLTDCGKADTGFSATGYLFYV